MQGIYRCEKCLLAMKVGKVYNQFLGFFVIEDFYLPCETNHRIVKACPTPIITLRRLASVSSDFLPP